MAHTALGLLAVLSLAGCSMAGISSLKPAKPKAVAAAIAADAAEAAPGVAPLAFVAPAQATGTDNMDALIAHYAAAYDVPETLIRRVIVRESGYNPRARNGPNIGLMQIQHATAHSMGYRGGPDGLLDAETNLRYAVRYLRGAWIVGRGDPDAAVRFYSRGYYYDAKRMGLLDEVGL